MQLFLVCSFWMQASYRSGIIESVAVNILWEMWGYAHISDELSMFIGKFGQAWCNENESRPWKLEIFFYFPQNEQNQSIRAMFKLEGWPALQQCQKDRNQS